MWRQALTGPGTRRATRATLSFLPANAVMGEVRRKTLLDRAVWLHAGVIPAAFPRRRTRRISGAVDLNLEREWTWISTDRGPRAWKQGPPDPDQGGRPGLAPRPAPVRLQQFHKVPRREFGVVTPRLSSPDGGTGRAFNFDNPMLKTEPRATCGRRRTQHDRNVNAVINLSLYQGIPYCPQAGGRCSVTGRLWLFPDRDGETSPATRFAEDRRTASPAPNRGQR